MCGIAGYVSAQPDENLAGHVFRMTESLARRGPDGQGAKQWPQAALGHRRLAILDLSELGAQPMISDDGHIGLVFNGCIYNFNELRAELEAEGSRFRSSSSDTEVLLRGVEAWGVRRLVERMRGMFAFGVWNDREKRLWLVRDRLGVKPLLYCEKEGRIAFASTASALAAGGWGGSLNVTAVLDYFKLGFIPDDNCVYAGIKKLAPGSILEWSPAGSSISTYWTLPQTQAHLDLSFDEATAHVETLFLEAVRLRLHADVPMGVLLSAGVDSALVCWAASQFKPDLTAFTVSAPGDPEDETGGASETAKTLGVRHEVVSLPAKHDEILGELVDAYGEPFACSSALAMIQVARAIKPQATVLLTGDGGDDVFLGYPFFLNFYLSQRVAQMTPKAALRLWPKIRPAFRGAALQRFRHFADYTAGGLDSILSVRDGLRGFQERGLLGPRFEGLVRNTQPDFTDPYGRQVLDDVIGYAQSTWFTGEFLTKVDGGAMYHALEARSPLLDDQLWEFAAALPYSLRLRKMKPKAILRDLVGRRVGPNVAQRKKQGFSIPVERWLAGIWKDAIRSMADNSILERDGWVDGTALRNEIKATLATGSASSQMWRLLVLEKWLSAKAN